MLRSQHSRLQFVDRSSFDLEFENQNNVKALPQCAKFTRSNILELSSSQPEVSNVKAMSYGTFADGQICAQTYVTLLHVCFSCHGHLTVCINQQVLLQDFFAQLCLAEYKLKSCSITRQTAGIPNPQLHSCQSL